MRWLLSILAALAFLVPPCAFAQNQPSPSNAVPTSVSCTSAAGVLVAAQPGRFHVITIENTGTTAFYIGGSPSVTASSTGVGFLIPGVQYSSFTFAFSGTLYCITASSTATVSVIELF